MNKLVVRQDRRKLVAIIAAFAAIAACMVGLGLSERSNGVLLAISVVLALVFAFAIFHMVRRFARQDALFELDEDGVTDLSKPEDVITLPWSQVVSVSLKAANSNDLMLDVMGYKTVDEFDVVTPEMRAQLDQTGGDRIYYLLELSGLWVRRARVKDAFDWIREHTAERFPQIVFDEFKDPLSKLGKQDREPGRRFVNPIKKFRKLRAKAAERR